MNSNDIRKNSFKKNAIVCDVSKRVENTVDDDDFDVYDIVSSDITPVNSTLQRYIKSIGEEVTNDLNGTTGEEYGNGDNRGNPYKRYKDVLIMYNYLRDNLKLAEMKNLFDSVYKDVISCMYSKGMNNDIGFEELMYIGLVPTLPTKVDECKGYIIHAYRKIVTESETCKFNYGYIYEKGGIGYNVIPFSNGKEKSLGKRKTVPNLLKKFQESYSNKFDRKSVTEILIFTNDFFIKSTFDPGFKYQFTTDNIVNVRIQSLIYFFNRTYHIKYNA